MKITQSDGSVYEGTPDEMALFITMAKFIDRTVAESNFSTDPKVDTAKLAEEITRQLKKSTLTLRAY